MRVIRDSFVIESRTAPAALAEQYVNVMKLRYPNDQVRCDIVTEMEAAHPESRPFDPRN